MSNSDLTPVTPAPKALVVPQNEQLSSRITITNNPPRRFPMLTTTAFWGGISCIPLGVFILWGAFLASGGGKLFASGAFILSIYGLSYAAFLFLQLGNNYTFDREGITLPSVQFVSAGLRLRIRWSEVVKAEFAKSSGDSNTDQLLLYFTPAAEPNSTFMVPISFKNITEVELKKLIYAIVNNTTNVEFLPPLADVRLDLPTVAGIKQINFLDFTRMWDEEYSSRYAPTLFVPMNTGVRLRDNQIEILELIACGGSAAVYTAEVRDGTKVILKEAVVPANANDALKTKALELFDREARLLSRLNHPSVAKVYDHFVENDHHYEVIQFIDGMDLRRFVKDRGPQPQEFVLNWSIQVCEILIYLHSQNPPIVHRDLTPDNLVLTIDSRLVLIDFGAANAFLGTATGTMVGKQAYMPPEQLRGKAVPQSDLYALGGTMYFLLTGSDPRALTAANPMDKVELLPDLNKLVHKCTAQEVHQRYDSAEELLSAIKELRIRNQI